MCFPKIHAEPERVHTASQTNTHNTPQTGGQVHTHATPTEEVRLAFCCYCNSVIPRCPRPNGGQGAGFCCVCTLCGLSLSYTGEWLFICLSTLHLVPHCLPTATGHHGCPLAAKLPSQIHYGDGSFLTRFTLKNFTIGRVCLLMPPLLPNKRHNCRNISLSWQKGGFLIQDGGGDTVTRTTNGS